MKNLLAILITLVLSFNLYAEEDVREVNTFTAIENNCSLDVYIHQGEDQKVVVVAPSKYLDKITTSVQASTLVIDVRGSLSYRNEDLYIDITVKDLHEITNNGSADFEIRGIFETDNLLLDMHGSGDFEGNFSVKDLEIKMHGSGDMEISGVNGSLELSQYGSGDFEGESIHVGSSFFKMNGSGDCEVNGSAAMLELSQSGSGDFDGRGFKVKTAKIRKSSSGEADVFITDTVDARLSGSGDLNIKGKPEISDFSVTGSGEIRNL